MEYKERSLLYTKGLTPRQVDVCEQILLKKDNKAISEALCVSEKTIKFHLTAIYKSLSLNKEFGFNKRIQLFDYIKNNSK